MPEPAGPTGVDEMPAQLRREVRLLGDILGQTLVEAGGPDLFEDVEELRRATIDLRGGRGPEREALARRVVEHIDRLGLDRAESVARAFTVYFQLVNLAEERHRVRVLRERSHAPGPVR